MRRVYTPPQLATKSPGPVLGALVLTLVVFMVLPFTQLFSHVQREILQLRQIEIAMPPPPPPPKQPPPEEKPPEEKPELKDKPPPLNLSQLELVLNPGVGGALQGDFGFGGFEMTPNVIEEMKIFELSEVDKEPQLLFAPEPVRPARAVREKAQGSVFVRFVVETDGRVSTATVVRRSSSRDLDDASVTAVKKYKFSPGIKDGQPVRVWFEREFVF